MTPIYHLYKTGTSIVSLLYPLVKMGKGFLRKNSTSLQQRFGIYPENLQKVICGRPRIWMHASSVGEVSVARAISREILKMSPHCKIIVSTTTQTGQAFAGNLFSKDIPILYAPVDVYKAITKALAFIEPDVMVFVETELWPNWTVCAHKRGIPIILVNGRISLRSMKKYEKIKSLTKETLEKFDCLSMIHIDDGNRIRCLGACKDKIKIHGNAKFDNLVREDEVKEKSTLREQYSLKQNDVVFVAGSIRQKESEIILKTYQVILKKHPEVLLFIAPRHIKRFQEIAQMATNMGLDYQLRSEFDGNKTQRTSPVVIIDTIGELAELYGVSTINFCGGSLVPLGGQNILEAVAWGKPVFYGPHMQDFQEARDLIESAVGKAFLVTSQTDLIEKAMAVLDHPEYGLNMGEKARQMVFKNSGAARKHAQVIINRLPANQ